MEITKEDIKRIWLTEEAMHIELTDGRTGKELFSDYPRLKHATAKQRTQYTTSEFGIHWACIDEDLSFEGFFADEKNISEIGKLFSEIKEINVSAFARKLGIAQPLMADYISGKKKPGIRRKKELVNALHHLGQKLITLHYEK